MDMSKDLKLKQILEKLNNVSSDIEGSAIVSNDGLVLASVLPSTVDEDLVSAMCAALQGLAMRAAGELNRGDIEQLYLKGTNGFMFMTQAGAEASLAVMANGRAKLGILFLDAKRAATEVASIL